MEIFVDDREQNYKIVEELQELGIECILKRLKYGDYLHEDIVFELKEINDFALSIIDGRMKNQIENMNKKFNKSILIIYGRSLDRKVDINENCLLGKITSILVKSKTKVLWLENERQVAFCIKSIIKKDKEVKDEKQEGN